MSEPKRTSGTAPELDLRAKIDARVIERRQNGQPPHAIALLGEGPALSRQPPNTRHLAARRHRRWRRRRGHAYRTGLMLVAAVVGGLLLRAFVVASFYIPSASMESTLHGCPGCEPDLVVVDKIGYRLANISRTDVLVFQRPPLAPTGDDKLIKRVIGLPGETVSGHGGKVYIGAKALDEPYVNPACQGTESFGAVLVPHDQYFMMGDNRCNSFDSRRFGTIARSAVVGRAFAVIWPVKHLRWL